MPNFKIRFQILGANFIVESFEKATRNPYTYLLINMHQLTPAVLMLTTNIFPDEDKPIKVFIENQNQ